MGANTIVFSILNAFYLRTASVRNPSELAMSIGRNRSFSWPEYQYDRDHNSSFSGLAAEDPTAHVYLEGRTNSQILLGAIVSANYFDLLGVKPLLGRLFVPDDETN
jgi:hypothetical protein